MFIPVLFTQIVCSNYKWSLIFKLICKGKWIQVGWLTAESTKLDNGDSGSVIPSGIRTVPATKKDPNKYLMIIFFSIALLSILFCLLNWISEKSVPHIRLNTRTTHTSPEVPCSQPLRHPRISTLALKPEANSHFLPLCQRRLMIQRFWKQEVNCDLILEQHWFFSYFNFIQ